MIVVGALMLLTLFWSPLVSCGNGFGRPVTISGSQIVGASVSDSRNEAPFWGILLGILPLAGLAIGIGTARAWSNNEAPRQTFTKTFVTLGVIAVALLGLLVDVLVSDARMGGGGVIAVTGNYWLLWVAVALIWTGSRKERTLARAGP